MRRIIVLSAITFTAVLTCGPALWLHADEISGPFFGYSGGPDDQGTPPAANNNLTGDTGFGWTLGYDYTSGYPYDININGFHLTQNTGGGNPQDINGALTGSSGTYTYVGGGYASSSLSGTSSNTFAGTYEIYGYSTGLWLNKTPGAAAISGPVLLQNGVLGWMGPNQVNSSAVPITMQGGTALNFNGNSDTLGTLNVAGSTTANILLGGNGIVQFNDSSALTWGADLYVKGWGGTPSTGGGANELLFGSGSAGLSSAEVAQTFFSNPSGVPTGFYNAKILGTGEVVPNIIVTEPAIEWSGETDTPMTTFGDGSLVQLTGDGTFGWQTNTSTVRVDLNGNNFTLNNGGGNYADQQGQLSGTGNVTFQGRGDWTWEGRDNHMGGSSANTYSGSTTINSGWLQLDKPAGVIAIPGNVQIGIGAAFAGLKLTNGNQIASTAVVTLQLGSGPAATDGDGNPNTTDYGNFGVFNLNGNNRTIAGLATSGTGDYAYVENSAGTDSIGTSTLTIAPSSGQTNTYAGLLRDGPAGAPSPFALVINGQGTQILSGSSSYTGGTTITNGSLVVMNAYSLPDGGDVTVGDSLAFSATVAAGQTANGAAITPVPEPSTLALVVAGSLLAISAVRRRKCTPR